MRAGMALAAMTACWLSALEFVPAAADNSGCTSVEARCALEAGGKCNRDTGHWCYGISRDGEHCGGSPAAFRTCMARHGETVPVSHVDRPGTPATADALGKCTTVQGRCVVEAGGYCDPRTGSWRIGNIYQHMYGGNYATFTACMDRLRAAGQK